MIRAHRFALFAALLCTSLLFSCTNNDSETSQTYAYCVYFTNKFCTEGPYTTCQGNGIPSNNCPYGSSSSSAPTQSGIILIGTQTWMAKNLDYNASGSKCNKCATYGRLYDWATAMNLPSSCNSSTCASRVSAKHQGICPSGWHIPSDAEWTTLTNFVGSSAGTKLKANSPLWNSNGKGTDNFGFAALPGGYGDSDGSFSGVGDYGFWWSATEGSAYSTYYWSMSYNDEDVYKLNYGKSNLQSVRCLQD